MGKKEQVYNNFFDEEKWSLVNPINKEIREDYTMELKQNQKKPSTIKVYRNDWRIVFLVVYDLFKNKSILELTKKDWRKLSLYFKEECNHSNARVNGLMSAVRSMLAYCEDDDDYEYDFSTAVKVKGLPKQETRETVFLSNEQIFKLRDKLIELEQWQKLALLFLAYDSAGRKNELFQCKKHNFMNSRLNVTNKVIGKRGKVFQLVYFSETKKWMDKYLEWRGEDSLDSVWVRKTKEGNIDIEVGTIYTWVKEMNDLLEEIEGREIDFTVHSFRHSSLENLCQNNPTHYALAEINRPEGLALEELQAHANHSDSNTTMNYIKDRTDEQKLTMFGFDPSEQISD